MKIHQCPFCQEKVKVKKVECHHCGIGFEGEFYTSPLLGLSEAEQSFIELFVLSSGSLKEMAKILGVSYPTVRSRLDQIIKDLKVEMKHNEEYKQTILEKVGQGAISPEQAARIIKNL